jgi:hypothetical protein
MIASLNKYQIDDVLHGQMIGRIGCQADGKVYVAPITYAYDADYIYCLRIEGMKINFMRINPNVCFEVESVESMAHWRSVILWGRIE